MKKMINDFRREEDIFFSEIWRKHFFCFLIWLGRNEIHIIDFWFYA